MFTCGAQYVVFHEHCHLTSNTVGVKVVPQMPFYRLFPAYSSHEWPVAGLPRVLATHGVSWVIPTPALPRVAFLHVGFPRAVATRGML